MNRLLPLALAIALALTGCSDDQAGKKPAAAPTAAPPPAGPAAGACYRIGFADLVKPSNAADPVPCTGPHTTETVHVGRIQPLVDGHLLALDSGRVQQQVARTCRARVARHLGGSAEVRRLARLQPVWFSPTLEQGDAGALWFRCDVVLLGGPTSLGSLPTRTRGVLARPGALNRFGTCGTAAPAARSFQRVACLRRHTWRVRATIPLPAKTRYLAAAAGKDADARCKNVAVGLAGQSLKFRWSFEWPTREQWQQGQRYGLCWTPDAR